MITTHTITATFPYSVAAVANQWLFANCETFKLTVEGPLDHHDEWFMTIEFTVLDDAAKFRLMFAD